MIHESNLPKTSQSATSIPIFTNTQTIPYVRGFIQLRKSVGVRNFQSNQINRQQVQKKSFEVFNLQNLNLQKSRIRHSTKDETIYEVDIAAGSLKAKLCKQSSYQLSHNSSLREK